MHLEHLLGTSIRGITAHKSRSFLTVLGIVIGITSIILIMSLGQGAQNLILAEIQSIGPKTIAIVPGRQPKGPTDILSSFTDSLKNKDLDALTNKANVPHLAKIMPVVFDTQTVSYGQETYRPTILGGTDLFAQIYNITPSEGRIFDNDEVKGYAPVVVLGHKVKDQLFGESEAVGERVKIKGQNFLVVGVIGGTGQVSFLNFDDSVFVPYTTAQQYLLGIHYFNRIVAEADSEKYVPDTVSDITATLRASHGITNPDKDDFFLQTQAEALKTVSSITGALTAFLVAVAAISLIVGGIGIMNIMLVSVTERTQEIGLRKALGATNRDILSQFLIEAILLTIMGGVIGIILGASLAFLVTFGLNRYGLNWEFVLPLSAVFLGLGVSSAIGLIFGSYPASQAAKKSPIEALRYE